MRVIHGYTTTRGFYINASILGTYTDNPYQRIRLHIDSGSPFTIISLTDIITCGINFRPFINQINQLRVYGYTGGSAILYRIRPITLILHCNLTYSFISLNNIEIYFPDPTRSANITGTTSLLGRDILFQMKTLFDKINCGNCLYFQI